MEIFINRLSLLKIKMAKSEPKSIIYISKMARLSRMIIRFTKIRNLRILILARFSNRDNLLS